MTDQTPEPVIVKCSRCGKDMPPLPDELARLARAAGGVKLTHEVCPGEEPEEPAGRDFVLTATVAEVLHDPDPDRADETDEMLSFRVTVRAEDLDAAMRPLAEAFGVKWLEAEKRASIADSRLS